jgi:hypothetical protein
MPTKAELWAEVMDACRAIDAAPMGRAACAGRLGPVKPKESKAMEIIGYPVDGRMCDWHGKDLGPCRVVSSWRVQSYVGTRMYQIEAVIDGIAYTGRGFGTGMAWRGKPKAARA